MCRCFGGRVEDATRRCGGASERWRVVFASDQSERLRDLLEDHEIYPRILKRGGARRSPPPAGAVDVVHAPLGAGFALPDAR